MGRTLHWTMTPKGKAKFTTADVEKLHVIGDKYNGPEYVWTCENFYPAPDIYPNWGNRNPGEKPLHDWDEVNAELQAIYKQGIGAAKANAALVKAGIARYHDDDWKTKIHGFCKVGGNELNAMLVVQGLTEISRVIDCTVKVSDEGDFLKCDLVIENGFAKPDRDSILRDIGWKASLRYNDAYKGSVDTVTRCEGEAKELAILLNDYERKVMAEQDRRLKAGLNPPYPQGPFSPVSEFCREVNPDDFKDHPEYNSATIMAGFYGEYYGRNGDKDPEAESYRMTGQIQNQLKPLTDQGMKLVVAPGTI